MIRDFAWDDYPAVRELWQITTRSALPKEELRATLDYGANLSQNSSGDSSRAGPQASTSW